LQYVRDCQNERDSRCSCFPHMALTRGWVTRMSSGVPVGAQMDVLLCTTNGCPFESTLVVPLSHCPVTQGPFAPGGGGNVQPATTYGAMIKVVGWPLTVTQGFGTVGVACPAWEHKTCAPTWTRKPGILGHHQGYFIDHYTWAYHFD
jgi:hypothetical protein